MWNNPGNVLFRQLVQLHLGEFKTNPNGATDRILQEIHKQNGRFISSDNQTVLIGKAETTKVMACFRSAKLAAKRKAAKLAAKRKARAASATNTGATKRKNVARGRRGQRKRSWSS